MKQTEALYSPLNESSLINACEILAGADKHLDHVYQTYGPPPLWNRPLGFGSLLQIILEQQVSLASAKACFDKLAARIEAITPANVLMLNDTELKAAGFSRQKIEYTQNLAKAIIENRIDFEKIHTLSDAEAKLELITLKGVGEWTSDIYLLMAMLRPDVMPKGDMALHAAYQRLSGLEKRPDSVEFIEIAEKWSPNRSAAARLLWHFYLRRKHDR